MKKKFYEELYLLEDNHWWHISKREISINLLKQSIKKKESKIIDIGCGTGKNIEAFSAFGETHGIDVSEDAFVYCKKRGIKNVTIGTAEKMGFKNKTFDIALMLDVLEHVNDTKALNEVNRILKNHGILVITAPAFQCLWSKWDEVLYHKRRYTKKSLESVLRLCGFDIKKISYSYSFLLFPAFLIRRLKTKFFKENYPSDFKMAPPIINWLMLKISRLEHKVISKSGIPFGTSVICIAIKNEDR